MKFEAIYNKELNEYEIYYYQNHIRGEIFCHLSESDFEIFKTVTMLPIFIKETK